MKTPLGIRTALIVYDGALRMYGGALTSHRRNAQAARRTEILCAFHDAVSDAAVARGLLGVLLRTIVELWDLMLNVVAPRRFSASVTGAPDRPPTPRKRASGWLTDARHSWRALMARKFDTGVTIALLTLGLVTTGSVFAVADALLLRPAPFRQADRLVEVWSENTGSGFSTPSVPRDLAARWLERTDLFASGGAYAGTSALVSDHGDPELIPATRVSFELFDTLGVRPLIGRNFTADEGHDGANRVAIIGADIWSSRFGRSPNVLNQTLRINDIDYRIVGVMPADFRFPYSKQRIWMPFEFRNPTAAEAIGFVTLVARMQNGVSRERLTSEIKAAGPEMAKLSARPWRMSAAPRFVDVRVIDTKTSRSIWMLFGATVLLMVTVCANVANLGLSQAFSRTRDAAIRSALGATRWRMIRQTLIEQMAVGVFALALSVPLTAGALKIAEGLLPISFTLSSLNALDVDWRLLAVMTVLALGAPAAAGLVPAIAGSRPSVLGALKQESRSVAGSRAARWYRKGLVIVEVACSVVLLISTALLIRSFIRLQAVDKGFDTHNLLAANVGFPSTHFADGVSRDLYIDQALARLRELPGVIGATAASGIPPEAGGISFGKIFSDSDASRGVQVDASVYRVQPEFFDTIGLRVSQGRSLESTDSPTDIVVSESFAAKVFPGQSAVGRRFHWDDESTNFHIVGVVATVRESTGLDRALPQIFQPVTRYTAASRPSKETIAEYRRIGIRVSDPSTAIPAVRAALKNVNAAILVQGVDRADDLLARNLDQPRFLVSLMLIFAVAGLILAAVGVYGVLSCLVAEQLREYGIRLVLGAPPSAIARSIVLGGLGTTLAGLVIGAGAAAMLGKTLSSVLFEVESRDAVSYLAVGFVLAISAIAAAWRPAHRARSVDPAVLLRNE